MGRPRRDYLRNRAIPVKTRRQIFERDNFTCQYCGARAYETELEIDHVIPRCKGGTNNPNNLVVSCKECNRKKRERDLEEWIQSEELERIRQKRKELGLSCEKAAQELKTTKVTVSRWEKGDSEPNDKTKFAKEQTSEVQAADDAGVTLIIQTNDKSREVVSKPGRLTFRNGDVLIDIPDTPENKQWFNRFLTTALNSSVKSEQTVATA